MGRLRIQLQRVDLSASTRAALMDFLPTVKIFSLSSSATNRTYSADIETNIEETVHLQTPIGVKQRSITGVSVV